MKEVQLKLIQGEKSKNSFLTLYLFLPTEMNMDENLFLRRIIKGDFLDFFLRLLLKYLTHLAPFFNVVILVLFMWFAMENPLRIQIVGCVKPEVVEGAFRKENLDFFHSSG